MTKIKECRHTCRSQEKSKEVLTDPQHLIIKHEHSRFFVVYAEMVFRCTKCRKEVKITARHIQQMKKIKDDAKAK